jgi:hypothetical protein
MSKTSIPLELQVILRDASIVECDAGKALDKVHKRAALQVNDYLHIVLIKFEAHDHGSASLETSIAETRLALDCVHDDKHDDNKSGDALDCVHDDNQSGDEEREAGVVV